LVWCWRFASGSMTVWHGNRDRNVLPWLCCSTRKACYINP
jgi:hypothetical protein